MDIKNMRANDIVDCMVAKSGMKKKDVASLMGWSPQNFTNRLRFGSLSADEFFKFADLLGYEVKVTDKESGAELSDAPKSTGWHVAKMVTGYNYDTDKAAALCHTPKIFGGWQELFKDFAGRYFMVYYFEPSTEATIFPVTKEVALQFYRDCEGQAEDRWFA